MHFKGITKSPFYLLSCLFFLSTGFWGCATINQSTKSTPNTSSGMITQVKKSPKQTIGTAPSPSSSVLPRKEPSITKKRVEATLRPSTPEKPCHKPGSEDTGQAEDFPKTTPQKRHEEEKPLFDIPIVMNPLVENFIRYYQTTGRKQFSIWLARSERYIPMMRKILREHGLPTDLVYLAMIESGFNPRAYSHRRASGPWQFISGTGRKYGLKVNYWIDERRDPEKSTVAAARYLKDLYDRFESWHLAAAAYNCGEGKLSRAIKRYNTENYWKLIRYHYLKRETRVYVPQMIAAALIAKEPEKYGFTNIQYQEPLKYELATVPGGVPLRNLARVCNCKEQTLRMLNPELIRRCTPPYTRHFVVKIPEGTKHILSMNLGKLRSVVKSTPNGWVQTHIVRRGDTLYGISLKYKVRLSDLRYLNHVHGDLLHIGQRLLIPAGRARRPTYARRRNRQIRTARRNTRSKKRRTYRYVRDGKFKEIVYVVRKGDNLWSIARSFNIHVRDICKLNPHISRHTLLHPSDRIKLRVPMAKFSSIPTLSLSHQVVQ